MLGYLLKYDEINLVFHSTEITFYFSVQGTVGSLQQEISTGKYFVARFSFY